MIEIGDERSANPIIIWIIARGKNLILVSNAFEKTVAMIKIKTKNTMDMHNDSFFGFSKPSVPKSHKKIDFCGFGIEDINF